MPPVPHQAESLDALRARYPLALAHEYDAVAIRDRGGIRPGECAANVFDFTDGLRLIVSRELLPDGRHVLHVSASVPPECRIADEMRLLGLTKSRGELLEKWARDVPRRFRELSGDVRELTFAFWSGTLIPHWFIVEPTAGG